ncbi:MAG: hypothetical protein M1830_008615 [Pleopsidium flavum]|nr:MAG: hypothetical protein M1830_008615 [Pleopsidium flavum]
MANIIDTLIALCAGRGLYAKLYHRRLEQEFEAFKAQIEQRSSSQPIAAGPFTSRVTTNEVTDTDTSATSTTVPQPQEGQSSAQAQAYRPRINSYIDERARGVQYYRAQRSYVSFEEKIFEERNHPGAQCGQPAVRNRYESEPTSSTDSSDSSQRPRSSASFHYSVPQLPKMVGFGRYRHSSAATDEWVREKFCYQLDEIIPFVGDVITLPGCPPRRLAGRKGSDTSTNSTSSNLMEEEVDPVTGCIIQRGFSATSDLDLSRRRRPRGWDMNRKQCPGSIQSGYELLDRGEELANLLSQNSGQQSEVEPAAAAGQIGPLPIVYHRSRGLNIQQEYRYKQIAGQGNNIDGQQNNNTRRPQNYSKIIAAKATDDVGHDILKDMPEGFDQRRVWREPATEAQNAAPNHDCAQPTISDSPEQSSRLASTEKPKSSQGAKKQRKKIHLVAGKRPRVKGRAK